MAKRTGRGSSANKTRAWFGGVTSNVVAGLILAALSVAGTFISGLLKVEKSPGGGIRVVRGNAPPSAPPPAIRLRGEGDRPDTVRLATDIVPLVRQHLRASPTMEGLAIDYRLRNLAFTGGSARRLDVRWAIGLPGTRGVACEQISLSFQSAPDLAERLAQQINQSIEASERRGEPACG